MIDYLRYDTLRKAGASVSAAVVLSKMNPYHDARGRFTSASSAMAQRAVDNGGFTYDPNPGTGFLTGEPGRPYHQHRVVVARPGFEARTPLESFQDPVQGKAFVKEYLARNHQAIANGAIVGGWYDSKNRQVAFDLVEIHSPKIAIALGRSRGENAVWDLDGGRGGQGREINTGGVRKEFRYGGSRIETGVLPSLGSPMAVDVNGRARSSGGGDVRSHDRRDGASRVTDWIIGLLKGSKPGGGGKMQAYDKWGRYGSTGTGKVDAATGKEERRARTAQEQAQHEYDMLDNWPAQSRRYESAGDVTHIEAMWQAAHGGSDNTGMHRATKDEVEAFKAQYGVAIPPAWRYVMLSDNPEGTAKGLIARGVADNGKVQPLMSTSHSANQADKKFARQQEFVRAMPKLDKALARDTAKGDPVAGAVHVMRTTGMRVDSTGDGPVKATRSGVKTYGASSLEARHVTVKGDTVRFRFLGKGSHDIDITVKDAALAKTVNTAKAGKKPGDRLFPGANNTNTSAYIASATGARFKNHDLRTLKATTEADRMVQSMPKPKTAAAITKARNAVGDAVSGMLGNTRQQALDNYINPAVFNAWSD